MGNSDTSFSGTQIDGDELYEIREFEIKGATNQKWWWQKIDTGALKGPLTDWNCSHYQKYFEHCTDRKTVVTAGGNMGLHTRAYAEMFEKVYVFEPDLRNFAALVRNCQYENVYFFRAGLGAEPGWGKINPGAETNTGTHRIEAEAQGHLPIMTVDQLGITDLNLLQLDVEGYEHHVIAGAEQTIGRCKPVIVAESYNANMQTVFDKYGYTPADNSVSDTVYVG